jgi:hypothetical protein
MVYSHFLCSFVKQVMTLNTQESTGGIAHNGILRKNRFWVQTQWRAGEKLVPAISSAIELDFGGFKENHHHQWMEPSFHG